MSIKNPEAGSPAGIGLDGDQKVEFPEELQERFGARKWIAADPPAFLDHEGAEWSIKNPEAGSPAGIGLDGDQKVEFPEELQERFGARKWIAADPPAFLDHEGAE